jgi:hypothetical protein
MQHTIWRQIAEMVCIVLIYIAILGIRKVVIKTESLLLQVWEKKNRIPTKKQA